MDLVLGSKNPNGGVGWMQSPQHPEKTKAWAWNKWVDAGWIMSLRGRDMDGDGDMDVLGSAATLGGVTWWENAEGDGSVWTEHTVDSDILAWSVFAADIDGDGDTDLLAGHGGAGQFFWYENTTGDGSAWTEHDVGAAICCGGLSVFAADVDGDGDLDIYVPNNISEVNKVYDCRPDQGLCHSPGPNFVWRKNLVCPCT